MEFYLDAFDGLILFWKLRRADVNSAYCRTGLTAYCDAVGFAVKMRVVDKLYNNRGNLCSEKNIRP